MNTFFVRQLGGYWGSFNPIKHKLLDTERVVCAKDYSTVGSINIVLIADCKEMYSYDLCSSQESRNEAQHSVNKTIEEVRDFSLDRVKSLSVDLAYYAATFSNNRLNNEYWVIGKEVKCITISNRKVEESDYRLACKLADMYGLPLYQVDLPRIGYFHNIDEYMEFVERFGNSDRSTFHYIDDVVEEW